MALTVSLFASWGRYQETLTFWFCLKRELSVNCYASVPDLLSLCHHHHHVLTYLFTFPHEHCPHPAVHCYSPQTPPLPGVARCYGAHLPSNPASNRKNVASRSVFAPFLNQISPITFSEESDFGVTELSVEGEIVKHHLKNPVPWTPGNCQEKLIFQLFKAISFPSSFVKRTALGNESDGSPWTGTLHSAASLQCYVASIIPTQAGTYHGAAKPTPQQSPAAKNHNAQRIALGLETVFLYCCSFFPENLPWIDFFHEVSLAFIQDPGGERKQGYARKHIGLLVMHFLART